uniref:Laccase-2-like protein n=1 Tax=Plutella xylostella TaxID=51655 RepID=A0A291ID65_PLUXY|nr:laccase-2-like protein [Plutella xylostella]
MRLLVFCLLVVTNFSDNGKASIDSVLPASANVLLEDTTRSIDNSCYRPCKLNVKPRKCEYKFRIQPTVNDDGKTIISINDMVPGPSINVCMNDIIVVEVENRIPDQDIALHWHGVEQKGTPFMDGVPMVTQCPIGFGSKYKYAFRASKPGTFFYHADSVQHQSDGIFGALMVNQPAPFEPHVDLYHYDRSEEHTLIIAADFSETLTGNLENLSEIKPVALNINGDTDIAKIFVMENFAYRLRLINAIAAECPVVYSIDAHHVTAIATDGNPVKPVTAEHILLYPGERMDVVVRASQPAGGYWARARGYGGACAGLSARAMLLYSGFNYTAMLVDEEKDDYSFEMDPSSAIHGQGLESLNEETDYGAETIKSVYLGVDRTNDLKDEPNDFRYISDAMPKKPFFPAPIALRTDGVVQINGKSFLYPNAPLLLYPKEVRAETICAVGEEDERRDPQCVQVLNAERNDVIELALVNEGFGSNDTYTFHMHGSSVQIVATWQNPARTPLSKADFLKLTNENNVVSKSANPPLKDTIVVPNKGFTIIRMRLSQPGAWMLECRSCSLYSLPTAVVVNVPQTLPKSVLDSLPKCGNYRPPDVLLH